MNVIAHITGSTYEITLDDSMMYFVVAKYQDEEKTGSYYISIWPI
jgi:hypothetical protein